MFDSLDSYFSKLNSSMRGVNYTAGLSYDWRPECKDVESAVHYLQKMQELHKSSSYPPYGKKDGFEETNLQQVSRQELWSELSAHILNDDEQFDQSELSYWATNLKQIQRVVDRFIEDGAEIFINRGAPVFGRAVIWSFEAIIVHPSKGTLALSGKADD